MTNRRETEKQSIYGSVPIAIPAAHFAVFYNGVEEMADHQEQKLSDLFSYQQCDPQLELKVTVLNINYGHNQELMEQCRSLREYSQYVLKVRTYLKEMELKEAVLKAVEESVKEGILKDFFARTQGRGD